MLPISLAPIGEKMSIKKMKGKDEVLQFLHRLGCWEGAEVVIVSKLASNIIVNVEGTRIALDKNMANRIMV